MAPFKQRQQGGVKLNAKLINAQLPPAVAALVKLALRSRAIAWPLPSSPPVHVEFYADALPHPEGPGALNLSGMYQATDALRVRVALSTLHDNAHATLGSFGIPLRVALFRVVANPAAQSDLKPSPVRNAFPFTHSVMRSPGPGDVGVA